MAPTLAQVLELKKEGFSHSQIVEMFKESVQKTEGVTTSKTTPQNKAAKEALASPKVISSSAGVLNSEVEFGGMQGIKFLEYTPKKAGIGTLPSIYLSAEGSGYGSKDGLFIRVSDAGGNINPLETVAKIDLALKMLERNATVLDTAKSYFMGQAEELGLAIRE